MGSGSTSASDAGIVQEPRRIVDPIILARISRSLRSTDVLAIVTGAATVPHRFRL